MAIDLSLVTTEDLIQELQERCDASIIALHQDKGETFRRIANWHGDYAQIVFMAMGIVHRVECAFEHESEDFDEVDDDDEEDDGCAHDTDDE